MLSPVINEMAKYIPSRRKRKLHIGLFGYARSMDGITLPRAITFTASLYSLGLPPEILGLNALSRDDMKTVQQFYVNFEDDLRDALRFFNPDTAFLPEDLRDALKNLPFYPTDRNPRGT